PGGSRRPPGGAGGTGCCPGGRAGRGLAGRRPARLRVGRRLARPPVTRPRPARRRPGRAQPAVLVVATVAGADPAPGPAAARRLPTAAQAVADRGPGNRPGTEGGRPLSPARAAEPTRARRAPPPGGDEDHGGDRRDDVPVRKHDQDSPEEDRKSVV